MELGRPDELLINSPQERRPLRVLPEKIARQLRVIFQAEKRNPERHFMHQFVQTLNSIARQRLADHPRRERPHLHQMIFESQWPRLPRDRAQDNRRIRKPMLFTKENKLRLRQFAPDHLRASTRQLPILDFERQSLRRHRVRDQR
jgi:hypothetical protein